MQINLNTELYVFAMSVILGAAFGVLSDFFSALKKSCGGGTVLESVCNILLWAVFFFGAWMWLLYVNSGELRFYEAVGAGGGLILYKQTVGRVINPVFCFIIEKILLILHFIFKILLTPPRFLYKIYIYLFYRIRKKSACGKKGAYSEHIREAETKV